MRVTAAFSRLLDLRGVWVRKVCFEPDRVVVTVLSDKLDGDERGSKRHAGW